MSVLKRLFEEETFRTEAYQNFFRQRLILLINDQYRKTPSSKKNPEKIIEEIFSDFYLGIDLVRKKQGDDGLKKYMKFPEQFITIGRMLREKTIMKHKKEIDAQREFHLIKESGYKSMSFAYSEMVEKAMEPPSSLPEDEVRTNPLKLVQDFGGRRTELFSTVEELEKYEEGLLEIISVLSLRKVLDLASADISTVLMTSESGVKKILHVDEGRLKPIELAVFCAVFGHLHPGAKDSKWTLKRSFLKYFLRNLTAVVVDGRKTHFKTYKSGVKEKYKKACEAVFKEKFHEACLVLDYCLDKMLESINDIGDSNRKRPPEYFFPMIESRLEQQVITAKEKTFDEEVAIAKGLGKTLEEIIRLSKKDLKEFFRIHSHHAPWREMILTENKDKMSSIVDLFDSMVDAGYEKLAAQLFYIRLDFDLFKSGDWQNKTDEHMKLKDVLTSQGMVITKKMGELFCGELYNRLAADTKKALAIIFLKNKNKSILELALDLTS